MLHERLWQAWSVRKRAVPISPALQFSSEGLVLGAGTVLLPAEPPRRLANHQGEEARLLALLSATYGKAIAPSVLGNIERAAKSWREGDDCLAAIHLAHARLPQFDDPTEAARRLFVTDAFIKAGTSPVVILQALGLHRSYVDAVAKLYNPLQPRVPAGNSMLSGRWTKTLSFLGELTAAQAGRLGVWAVGQLALEVGGAVATAGLLLVPSPNRIRVEDEIKGLPGGRYSWNRDETQLHIVYETADGEQRTFIAQLKEQEFLGPQGQVVGRVLPQGDVVFEANALPGRPANDNEPKLCPQAQLDRRTNDKGLAYEAYMRPIVNPFMPTPLGFGYYLPNPSTGKAVEFDDCQQMTGIMIDYKDRYWKLLSNPDTQRFINEKLSNQALDQVSAAGERKIRWYFSEKQAADYIRDLFDEDRIRRSIDIVWRPMPESAR